MGKSEWIYYNHALIPSCAPHETPDVAALDDKELWKQGKPVLARWTTDFDCQQETGWWYCICERPFDMLSLKSKRRNVVKNALKYCEVRIADPLEYEDELRTLFNEVQSTYPAANRSMYEKDSFHRYLQKLCGDKDTLFFVCFLKEEGVPSGYAIVKSFDGYLEYQVQKVLPCYEKYQTNAALVYAILEYYADRLRDGCYVCDGARNINHATNFQAYLEKYFGFRKAYCKLNIRYRRGVKTIIYLLYPFRSLLAKLDHQKLIHQINGILKMEEIRRQMNG